MWFLSSKVKKKHLNVFNLLENGSLFKPLAVSHDNSRLF